MFYEDINVGDKRILAPVTVERDKMLAFANLYNPAPCHADEKFAAGTRNGDVTSPGIYTFALMFGQYAPQDFGFEQTIGGSDLSMNFVRPVFAGDVLHGEARVDEKFDRNPYNGGLWITIDIYNQNDELVLTARSSSVVLKKNTPASKDK